MMLAYVSNSSCNRCPNPTENTLAFNMPEPSEIQLSGRLTHNNRPMPTGFYPRVILLYCHLARDKDDWGISTPLKLHHDGARREYTTYLKVVDVVRFPAYPAGVIDAVHAIHANLYKPRTSKAVKASMTYEYGEAFPFTQPVDYNGGALDPQCILSWTLETQSLPRYASP